jgi:hypothetical protein
VCMALKTLQCCGNTSSSEQSSDLRAIHTLNNPKKYTSLLGGLSAIYLMRRHGAKSLMWGTRGAFPLVAAMVVAIVMPVVFGLRLLKNTIKTLKLVVSKEKKSIYYYYCNTYCNLRNPNCSVARARTSLVRWNPGILGIAGKLITSPRWLHHHIWVTVVCIGVRSGAPWW